MTPEPPPELSQRELHELACLYYLQMIFWSGDVRAIREAADAVMRGRAAR